MGVECYRLCKALAKKGVDIEFILPYTADHHNIDFMKVNAAHPQTVVEVTQAGSYYDSFRYVDVHRANNDCRKGLATFSKLDLYGQVAMYEEAVGRIVQLAEFDVIHAHDWLTCRAAIRAKMISGKPLVIHIHSLESDRSGQIGGGNPLVREIEALGLQLADKIIAVSQVTKNNIIREYDIPAEKIEVVHNNLDVSALIPTSGDNAYTYLTQMKKDGYRVVVNVGRLTIQKGLSHLLESFAIACRYTPKAFLLIVGKGEQFQELIELAAQLGIGKQVIFTDFQRGKRWRDAFAIADLFVLPSPTEPFAITALEAIGYGTPILVSKETGVAEVICNALRVDFWDHNEMANKIAAVLQNDPLRDELHQNAYHELEQMSYGDTTADRLSSVYERQLAREMAA
jgi:glycosyltransferase involved in cell wall biosynthesis